MKFTKEIADNLKSQPLQDKLLNGFNDGLHSSSGIGGQPGAFDENGDAITRGYVAPKELTEQEEIEQLVKIWSNDRVANGDIKTIATYENGFIDGFKAAQSKQNTLSNSAIV